MDEHLTTNPVFIPFTDYWLLIKMIRRRCHAMALILLSINRHPLCRFVSLTDRSIVFHWWRSPKWSNNHPNPFPFIDYWLKRLGGGAMLNGTQSILEFLLINYHTTYPKPWSICTFLRTCPKINQDLVIVKLETCPKLIKTWWLP